MKVFKVKKVAEEKQVKDMFARINNWVGAVYFDFSLSGNGDDMCKKGMETGTTPVDPDELPQQGGDRLDFLRDRHPIVMYAWFLFLKYDLWASAKTEFPTGYQAEDGKCPSVATSDFTNSTTKARAASSVKRTGDALEASNQESKKMRQVLAYSCTLDGYRGDIRSLVVQQSTLSSRRSTLEDQRIVHTTSYNEYNLRRIMATDNQAAQDAISKIMGELTVERTKVQSEIDAIIEKEEAIATKLGEKEDEQRKFESAAAHPNSTTTPKGTTPSQDKDITPRTSGSSRGPVDTDSPPQQPNRLDY